MCSKHSSLVTSTWQDDKVLILRNPRWQVNCVVLDCGDGLVVIDTLDSPKSASSAREIIKKHFSKPVMVTINTHHHYDHVLGNQLFSESPIYAHELVPGWMDSYEEKLLADVKNRKSFEDFVLTRPTELLSETISITVGDQLIELLYLGPCHTNNDIMIHAPGLKTIITGDIFVPETVYPINPNSGGDIINWIYTLIRLVQEYDDCLIIPGHFDPCDHESIIAQGQYLQTLLTISENLLAIENEAEYIELGTGKMNSFSSFRNFLRYHGRNLLSARSYIQKPL